MTPSPKTEIEKIDEAAKKYSTYDGTLIDKMDFIALDQCVGFKAGVAWARENPLPHPDTVRLEWMIKYSGRVSDQETGHFFVSYYGNLLKPVKMFQTPHEAIDAAMKEGKT